MSFSDERQAIESRLDNGFSAVPIKYENVPFDPPKGSPYIALTILSGNGINASIGTDRPLLRHAGIIQLDIFVPEDTGTEVARTHADSLDTLFKNVQFSAGSSGLITTRVPFYTTLGIEQGWYRAVLSVAYQRDKIG